MGRVNGQVQHEVKLQQKFKELVFRMYWRISMLRHERAWNQMHVFSIAILITPSPLFSKSS